MTLKTSGELGQLNLGSGAVETKYFNTKRI
jgi:hypothetical protein